MRRLHDVPAEVHPTRHEIDLLIRVLSHIGEPEHARFGVEREPPWIAEAIGPDLTAYAGSEVLFSAVKTLTNRSRPPDALAVQHFHGLAFPSGHATQATAVWGMLAALIAAGNPSWRRTVAVWTAVIVIAGLVGVTRLYLGAHWLTDVLAGWAFGALWLTALLAATRAFDHVGQRRAPPRPSTPLRA